MPDPSESGTAFPTRINVVGVSGSGKSIFAKRLSELAASRWSKWMPYSGNRIGRCRRMRSFSGSFRRPLLVMNGYWMATTPARLPSSGARCNWSSGSTIRFPERCGSRSAGPGGEPGAKRNCGRVRAIVNRSEIAFSERSPSSGGPSPHAPARGGGISRRCGIRSVRISNLSG